MNSGTESQFVQLNETRRRIYEVIKFLNDVSFPRRMQRLLMQYETSIRESFELAKTCPLQCRMMARILSGLTEIIQTMSPRLQNDCNYCERMCNIVAYYIACELCAAQEKIESKELIVDRIKMAIRTYVKQNTEHLLKTFVGIPMLFHRSDIVTELNKCFLFTQWEKDEKIVQAELADKIYIQYILIFYDWQSLMCDEAKKEMVIEFADKFMRPSRSLASNNIYAEYLPNYSARSTATRYILEHLKETTSQNLHVASKVDNRLPLFRKKVELASDDEEEPLKPFPSSTFSKANSFVFQSSKNQTEESRSTDQPTSLPSTENNSSAPATSPATSQNQSETVMMTSSHSNPSVQTGEEIDNGEISTCVLYSDTQFSTSIRLIYPVQINFCPSRSSMESVITKEAANRSMISSTSEFVSSINNANTVECLSPITSLESLRWQACKELLLPTDNTIYMPSAPCDLCSSAESTEIQSNSVDLKKLETKARNYLFKRQKFFKLGKAHNKFYRDLLIMERKSLRHLKEEQKLYLIRQTSKRLRQLRALNDKRRHEAEQLEHHLAAIRNS